MERTIEILKIGSDSELFLSKGSTSKKIGDGVSTPDTLKMVPVCGLVGGTKESPRPVPALGDGYAVQEDNVMLEFNIPPASSANDFASSMTKMLAYLKSEMKSSHGLDLVFDSAADFDHKEISEIPQAMLFGCEPDFNVWKKAANERIKPSDFNYSVAYNKEKIAQTLNGLFIGTTPGPQKTKPGSQKAKPDREFRSTRVAGTHIHTSFLCNGEPPTLEECEALVKAMDLFLAIPCTLISKDRALEARRRRFYGRAGSFRLKEYGIEYRTLGSGVLSESPDIYKFLFDQVHAAANYLNSFSSVEEATTKLALIYPSIFEAVNNMNFPATCSLYSMMDGVLKTPPGWSINDVDSMTAMLVPAQYHFWAPKQSSVNWEQDFQAKFKWVS